MKALVRKLNEKSFNKIYHRHYNDTTLTYRTYLLRYKDQFDKLFDFVKVSYCFRINERNYGLYAIFYPEELVFEREMKLNLLKNI